jgi:ATP-dependent DNA helicase RecG
MVELFDSRVEITNSGTPLITPERFIDAPPRSRNESISAMMRRIGVCEERGSGWDKVGFEIELHQLPAPLIELPQNNTRVVLFSPKPLKDMDKEERVRAVYLHACLRHVTRQHMTNSSLRERFSILPQNSAQASRLIAEAIEASLIAAYDPQAGRKFMRYVPIWASNVS